VDGDYNKRSLGVEIPSRGVSKSLILIGFPPRKYSLKIDMKCEGARFISPQLLVLEYQEN